MTPSTIDRLQPLLNPRSIAVVGASARPKRPGHNALKAARAFEFDGPVYPVTPGYDEIDGERCHAAIADLPEPVDLAIITAAAERAPGLLEEAVAAGARSAHVIATLLRDGPDGSRPFDAVRAIATDAGLPLLGPGAIGYMNYAHGKASTWILPSPNHLQTGGIALLVQSGSTYAFCNHLDPRLRFSMTAHPGQEAVLTSAVLLEYMLSLPETKVLGLYLETVQDPDRFADVLAQADARDIPVVVFKPGRSRRAAEAIASHAGRLAGDDAIFDALFRRHGVVRVDTMDAFYATLLLFANVPVPGPGGLVAVTDSGGQRSVLIDAAERTGLRLAQFSDETRARLREVLAPDLPDDNPIDMWGGEENVAEHIERCIDIAMNDPDTALVTVMTELGADDTDGFVGAFARACAAVAPRRTKPVLGMSFTARQFYDRAFRDFDAAGLVVLDGVAAGTQALAGLFAYRDRHAAGADPVPQPLAVRPEIVSAALDGGEREALDLIASAGIPVIAAETASNEAHALAAFARLGGPVALKTAEDHAHKSDVGGVVLGLADAAALAEAYREMTARLGPRVLVSQMAVPGVEVAFGAVTDTPFGPAVMFGAGGTLVEVLDDVTFELAPFGPRTAEAMISRTRISRLLDGVRGQAPADRTALIDALVGFSRLVAGLGRNVAQIDINPLIVTANGCIAADALVAS